MVIVYWCCGYYGDYPGQLSRSVKRVMVMRKDRKYSLMRPCWFEVSIEAFSWMRAVVFGKMFSSHVMSSEEVASFWLIVRYRSGGRRCMIVGKYPSERENLVGFEGRLYFRFCVLRLISNAIMKPRVVIVRAVSFRYRGMVVRGVVMGGMLLDRMKPAKMLPSINRMMGLISEGLFSLMVMWGGNRGWFSSV